MKKIEEGEYVRISYMYGKTKIGKIRKVLDKDPCYKNMQMYSTDVAVKHDNTCFVSHNIYEVDVLEHSHNLIDIIHEGDYVNGYKVTSKYKDVFTKEVKIRVDKIDVNWQGDMSDVSYSNKDIVSVLTKERFEKEKYEV